MGNARRIVAVGVVAAVLASCGGSDDADEPVETGAPTTEAETDPSEDFTPADGEEDVPLGSTASGDDAGEEAETTDEDSTAETAETDADTGDSTATTEDTSTDGGAEAAGAVDVSMVEWAIDAPTEYTAGDVTFTATNDGNFPHEFVVIQGDGYESLPLAEGGAVIEDDLPPDTLIERTDRLSGGSTADLTVTLEPGNYVLLCNLGGGSNSHAGQGQTLDITVS
ncbi:hypothetical protein [Ilumatobacter nonamiensis]|uniref:hypothetical protein n=1 Tax=Ilumatobacter nonamiensis TaxID=467093 RepID=UPI0006884B9D|nr:hypothetical protein [Ilumatobacter nonamiensis]